MLAVHNTYYGKNAAVNQYKYPSTLYESELHEHALVVDEYIDEVTQTMHDALERTKPAARFLEHQPYLTPSIRYKLVDFGLKLLVRLKVLPYVFCRSVRLFDRYCLKRIVLLPQGQLIMATCVWIAAKVHGGNCHFANMHSDRPPSDIRSVLDLGFGAGARFNGPTQRYRLPRVMELIRLCGSRCGYTVKMFHQMEIYIMTTLDWDLTEPGIDDYLISLDELNTNHSTTDAGSRPCDLELRRMKQFVAYAACFLYESVSFSTIQVAKLAINLVNHTAMVLEGDPRFQVPNQCVDIDDCSPDYFGYSVLRRLLVSAVAKSPAFLLDLFADKGPRQLFFLLSSTSPSLAIDVPKIPSPLAQVHCAPSMLSSPSSAQFGDSPVTPKEFTYERVTEVAKSVKRLAEKPSVVASHDDPCPRSCRRNTPGLLTPTSNPANLHSHHYPTILHAPSANYTLSNRNWLSLSSFNSPKENEIFDLERPRLGMATPASSDNGCKDRSFADMPAPMFKRLL